MVQREPHQHVGQGELGRLVAQVLVRDTTPLARHAGQVETSPAGNNRVKVGPQFSGAQARKIVQHRIAEQLHGISREEE